MAAQSLILGLARAVALSCPDELIATAIIEKSARNFASFIVPSLQGRKTGPKFRESRQITGDKIAGVTGVFRGVSRARGPSQQTTKTDRLSYRAGEMARLLVECASSQVRSVNIPKEAE